MFNQILCTTLVVLCIGIIGCIWCLCRIASKQTPTPDIDRYSDEHIYLYSVEDYPSKQKYLEPGAGS